jgi:ParB-like chromosome segregation protein Spo0J
MNTNNNNKIKEHKLIGIPTAELSFDADNPNVMSREQMQGLRAAMEKWGYLVPVIVDRNNIVVDGQHRLLVYREMGMGKIPAYKLDLDSVADAKELRQVMNKLKGTHELTKDLRELAFLHNEGKLDELAALIGQNAEALAKMIQDNADALIDANLGEAKELAEKLKLGLKCPECGYEW